MNIARHKWIVFLLLIVAFVILDAEIKHVTLAQRGIVLGIGIDREGEEYVTTCEILAPSNLGAESYQKNRLLSVQRGTTLAECFEKMGRALGVRISLKHTVLIVLGESVMQKGDYTPLTDLFIGNEVADDTYIVGVEGEAKELFSARSPMYRTISYKIAETFRSPDIESGVVSTNVKDFFAMHLGESKGIYIPLVEVGKGDMSESNGEGESETDSLIFGRVVILDDRGQRAILTTSESEGLSYIYSHVNEANLYVENGDEHFDADIIETRCDRECDVASRSVTLKVTMWLKLDEETALLKDGSKYAILDEKKKLAGETIKKQVLSAVDRCREVGVDIVGIRDAFWKKMGKAYREYIGDDYLDEVAVNVAVNIVAK